VYAVKVQINQQTVFGVANVGTRPTLAGQQAQLEVHLFNFNEKLYGLYIRGELITKLREERKFDSFELLHKQIIKDADQAKLLVSEL
jgi:riboflavin kinase/FMN adenylyltransferase